MGKQLNFEDESYPKNERIEYLIDYHTDFQFIKTKGNDEEILSKWEKIGLLDAFNSREKKLKGALLFEDVVNNILNTRSNDYFGIKHLILPIIARVVSESSDKTKIKLKYITEIIRETRPILSDLMKYDFSVREYKEGIGHFDAEAEYCLIVGKIITEKLKPNK